MPSPCSAADLKKCSAALRLRGTPCEPAWYLRWEGAAVSSGGGAEGGGGRGGGGEVSSGHLPHAQHPLDVADGGAVVDVPIIVSKDGATQGRRSAEGIKGLGSV